MLRRPSQTLPRLTASGGVGLLAVMLAAVTPLACGEQTEGERCDPNNGSYDCESGLECKRANELNIEGRGVGLCCPPDGVTPTVDACRANARLPDEDDYVPPPMSGGDAGDEPTVDAGDAGG